MDKPRWLLTYLIGSLSGEAMMAIFNLHSFSWWVFCVGSPLAAMLIEDFRNRRQNNRWRAW